MPLTMHTFLVVVLLVVLRSLWQCVIFACDWTQGLVLNPFSKSDSFNTVVTFNMAGGQNYVAGYIAGGKNDE